MKRKMDHELSLAVLYVCIKNLLSLGVFIFAAIEFRRWWMVLFAFAFQSSTKTVLSDFPERRRSVEPEHIMSCDYCGELLFVRDVEHAVHGEMQFYGWHRIEVGGRWRNICPHCIQKYKPKLEYNNEVQQ